MGVREARQDRRAAYIDESRVRMLLANLIRRADLGDRAGHNVDRLSRYRFLGRSSEHNRRAKNHLIWRGSSGRLHRATDGNNVR